jgi:hypothetical protein
MSTDCLGALSANTPCQIPPPTEHPPPTPKRFNNFGGKVVLRYNQEDVRGVRAGIRTPPRNEFHLPYLTAGVMRVSAEWDERFLIQTGFGRTLRIALGACGHSPEPETRLHSYWETLAPPLGSTSPPIQRCGWRAPTQRGRSNLYTVYRKLQSAAGNPHTWQANINGGRVTQRNLGFDGAQVALAGGELVHKQNPAIFITSAQNITSALRLDHPDKQATPTERSTAVMAAQPRH